MKSFWAAFGLLILSGCISDQRRPPELDLVGAPEIVRPQRPPSVMRFDTARISSYRMAKLMASQSAQGGGQIIGVANEIKIGIDGQEVLIPVRPGEVPTLSLPDWAGRPSTQTTGNTGGVNNINTRPVRTTTYSNPNPNPIIISNETRTVDRANITTETEGNEIRNPSFNARRPILVPRYVYQPLSARELQKRVELSPKFQTSTAQWAGPIERWLDKAAAILRANPRTIIRITGFASNNEVGGRSLAEKRANTVATALKQRGVGGARIETEGRMVLVGRLNSIAQEEAARASRRAEIKIVSGKVEEDPFKPSALPPLEQ